MIMMMVKEWWRYPGRNIDNRWRNDRRPVKLPLTTIREKKRWSSLIHLQGGQQQPYLNLTNAGGLRWTKTKTQLPSWRAAKKAAGGQVVTEKHIQRANIVHTHSNLLTFLTIRKWWWRPPSSCHLSLSAHTIKIDYLPLFDFISLLNCACLLNRH